jgi:hypothetical protein
MLYAQAYPQHMWITLIFLKENLSCQAQQSECKVSASRFKVLMPKCSLAEKPHAG